MTCKSVNGRLLQESLFTASKNIVTSSFSFLLSFLSCLFGEESITPECLLASFKDYNPAENQEVLDECLGDSFEENNQDVIDFLSFFKCFRMHSKENIVEIINE